MNLERRTEDHEDRFVSEKFVKSVVIGALFGGSFFLLIRLLRLKKKRVWPVHPPIIIKSIDDTGDPIGIDTDDPLQELKTGSEQIAASIRSGSLYQLQGFGPVTFVGIRLRTHGTWNVKSFKTSNGCEIRMWLQYLDGGLWKDEPGGPHLTVFGTSSDFQLECDPLSPDTVTSEPQRPHKRKLIKNGRWRIGYVEVVGHGRVNRGSNTKMEIGIDNA